jgi:probable F420-dependent oxidoreductase
MKFWMATAFLEPEQLFPIVDAAEEGGFHGVAFSDHIFYAKERQSDYPYSVDGSPIWQPDTPWLDCFTAIGACAGRTERLQFTTNVYVAPARDLWTVAKQVSTAAVLSKNRVSLGLAAGWSKDEFDQTGQDFDARGKRLDEMIPALRELWQPGWHEFHGEHYDFDALTLEPTPTEVPPIYVGGHSPAAIRRAARFGDGWIGTYYTPDDAEAMLAKVADALAAEGRTTDGFEIVLSLLAKPDVDLYRRFEDLGVTAMVWAPWMLAQQGPDHASLLEARIDATHRFCEEIVAPLA